MVEIVNKKGQRLRIARTRESAEKMLKYVKGGKIRDLTPRKEYKSVSVDLRYKPFKLIG